MIGIDIIEISRFRDMNNLEMFIRRVFTQNETDYFAARKNAAKSFYASIAGHFPKQLEQVCAVFRWQI